MNMTITDKDTKYKIGDLVLTKKHNCFISDMEEWIDMPAIIIKISKPDLHISLEAYGWKPKCSNWCFCKKCIKKHISKSEAMVYIL